MLTAALKIEQRPEACHVAPHKEMCEHVQPVSWRQNKAKPRIRSAFSLLCLRKYHLLDLTNQAEFISLNLLETSWWEILLKSMNTGIWQGRIRANCTQQAEETTCPGLGSQWWPGLWTKTNQLSNNNASKFPPDHPNISNKTQYLRTWITNAPCADL